MMLTILVVVCVFASYCSWCSSGQHVSELASSANLQKWQSKFVDESELMQVVNQLIKNYSYVMDLSLQEDMELYTTIPKKFLEILPNCEASMLCQSTLLNSVIRGMYDLYSHVTKDQLASGQVRNISISSLESSTPWAGKLLDSALHHPFSRALSSCNDDINPFHLASLFRMHQTMKKLLNIGELFAINCKAKNTFDFTPLHITVLNRDIKMTKLLLQSCATVSLTDSFGRTPIEIASDQYDAGAGSLIDIFNTSQCLSKADTKQYFEIENSNNIMPIECESKHKEGLQVKYDVDNVPTTSRRSNICPVDTVHVSNISALSFIQKYLSQRRPLLIKGGAKHWKIFETWQRNIMYQTPYSTLKLLVGNIPYAGVFGKSSQHVTLGQFMTYLDGLLQKQRDPNGSLPYYAFDHEILSRNDTKSFYDANQNTHPQWLMTALMEEGLSNHERESLSKTESSLPPTDIMKQFYWGPTMSVRLYIYFLPVS